VLDHADGAPPREPPLLAELRQHIEHAAHLLPAQGPITAFVHHNTLHALEELPFDDAVRCGAAIFRCQPYLREAEYRRLLESQRITQEDIRAALLDDLGPRADGFVGRMGTRYHLRLAMLEHSLETATSHELRWLMAETEALWRFRREAPPHVRKRMIDETRHWVMRDLRHGASEGPPIPQRTRDVAAELMRRFGKSHIEQWDETVWEAFCLQLLWQVCRQGVQGVPTAADAGGAAVRHRDVLLRATGEDSDPLVHETLIRFCAAFLDQGLAAWPLPHREQGYYEAFVALYRQGGAPPHPWYRGLPAELQRLARLGIGPLDSIAQSLEALGVARGERETYVRESLLALRGWAGMIWQCETRPDRVAHPAPPGSLIGYLAVRLILERFALAYVARRALGYAGPLSGLREVLGTQARPRKSPAAAQRSFLVFQLAQVLGWTPQELHQLKQWEWAALVEDLEAFSPLDRRRVFHAAYERRYRLQALDAVAAYTRRAAPADGVPRYQVICCIDEREESFRRHLEEIAPQCETLGAAGFFGVAMYYRGAADAHYLPLCPAIVRPAHFVREDAAYPFEAAHRRRARTRQALASALHRWHVESRTFLGGVLTALPGALASVPLVARVLFPRLTARVRRLFGHFVQPPPLTRLQLERVGAEPGPDNGHLGFSLEEMARIVERLLRDIGLVRRFSPLVVVMGHGSSSLNNPHESAHDCGACGGARGGPNARALAQMANDPRVRGLVAALGVTIPPGTVFVGAYHNTCDDGVTYFDLDRLPATHWELFDEVRRDIDLARQRNAHERCRRFESAPLSLTPEEALRHVEGRAEDLAQTRPEYGHATNALCWVGRRWRSRGLFLDRRAFLASYDPSQDDAEGSILTRILQAVIPVCAGISLEYYFSFVDSTGYGCGTKLPHNVTSLLGVMDGAASDLRPGLPWQMVEIHEPVRLLFLIETTPQRMLQIIDRNDAIRRLCRNAWVQIATLDPESSAIHVFREGDFEPYVPQCLELPAAESSLAWYRGWREHLGFAAIGPAASRDAPSACPDEPRRRCAANGGVCHAG
jgi:uncharacterized protein YbcC (UPF0753/DUF2309 family)